MAKSAPSSSGARRGSQFRSTGQKSSATSQRNATGYQKRLERKSKARADQGQDLYEYAAHRNKRGQVALDVDREEAAAYDRPQLDDDDDVDSEMETLRRKIAANMEGDLGVVDSEDDEDIDSDEAFEGESDEERFGAFKFAEKTKSKTSDPRKKAVRFPRHEEIDLDENEDSSRPAFASHKDEDEGDEDEDEDDDEEGEDEEEGDDEGTVSLSAMLDAPPSDEEESANEDEDEEMLSASDNEDADNDIDALSKLDSFIDTLSTSAPKKRKASDAEDGSSPSGSRKRRILPERTEAGAEGEFSAPTGGSSGKVDLNDLLKPLASGSASTLSQSAKLLASVENQPLAAPLHQRQQDRLDREAAYEATKQEVQKWAPTMKRIREAEHLSFPLQPPEAANTSNAELASKFKPTTELESAVDRLLKSAKLREQDIAQTEELEMKDLTVEEIAARRAELRQMRELMFRAEAKAKRVSKIKSKAYRKIAKKERAKDGLSLEEIERLDPEAAEVERMKLEAARAKERATMRHKNTGKWAKQLMAHGGNAMTLDQRRDLNEQLERGEALRRKIQGLNEDGEAPEGDDDDDDEGGIADVAQRAFDELAELDDDSLTPSAQTTPRGKKKKQTLMDMKFMRDAEDREQREVQGMKDDFQAELLGSTADGEDAPASDHDETPSAQTTVEGNAGRLVFRPTVDPSSSSSTKPHPLRVRNSNESDTSSVTLKSSHDSSTASPQSRVQHVVSEAGPSSASNPWLQPTSSTSGSKLSRRKNEVVVSKNSSAAEKSKATLKKQLDRTDEAVAREMDDAVVEISLDDVMTIVSSSAPVVKEKKKPKKPKKKKGKESVDAATNGAAGAGVVDAAYRHEDDEGDEGLEDLGKGNKAFEQRELVALAFAGDNVVEEFNAQKQREIEADAPTEVDTTLPGWGSWAGHGAKKAKPKPHLIKKITGVDATKRADYNKAHVIISEKKDKKASKYQIKDLPHPYTSRAQFERSLQVPVGAEWNTRTAFQKGTMPRVIKKIGAIINPIEKLV